MNDPDYIDHQLLGAFVDDEIDADNREAVIKAMEIDPEVRERVYRLRRAKDLMKLGFGDASARPGDTGKTSGRSWKLFSPGMAASVAALAVAFGASMLGHQYYSEQEAGNTNRTVAAVTQQQADKVILHVRESDPKQFAAALAYTEKFLREHESQGHQIDVVAHAGGLDLMRADASPLKAQIIDMMEKHNNVHFIACASAIQILRSKGVEPTIIRGVSTDSTAFDHIVGRLQNGGWRYIRVDSLLDNPGSA
jgi:intracellular sulfur oxidation DsrE/DsrF family protein